MFYLFSNDHIGPPKNSNKHDDDNITLFRSITILRGIDNIRQNIPSFILSVGIFCKIMSIPHKTAMGLNNVMDDDIVLTY